MTCPEARCKRPDDWDWKSSSTDIAPYSANELYMGHCLHKVAFTEWAYLTRHLAVVGAALCARGLSLPTY
jgi:hypothetical protein